MPTEDEQRRLFLQTMESNIIRMLKEVEGDFRHASQVLKLPEMRTNKLKMIRFMNTYLAGYSFFF